VPSEDTTKTTPWSSDQAQRADGPSADAQAHDPLTGLPTRANLKEQLRRRIAEWRRTQAPVSLVVLELDDFDRIRDLGPKARDFVVDAVARLLTAASREMDVVARAEDHQFAIMLPQSNLHEALVPAERVRKAIAACEKLKHQGTIVRFTVSAGVAEVASQDDADTLVERAETAMRQAAARGGNRIFFHNGQTCEAVLNTVSAEVS
jgi:diguanylate cyclase (GGDEF)-like protein